MRRDEASRSKPYGARDGVCMLREVSIAFAAGCADDGAMAQKKPLTGTGSWIPRSPRTTSAMTPIRSLAGRRALSPNLLISGVFR